MWRHGNARCGTPRPTPAQAYYAGLRRESRLRRWVLAAVVGGVIGVIVALRLSAWLGPLSAAVIAIGLLLWDRRVGVLAMWPGDRGSHRLAAAVARLERRGWAVLCAPHIPDQEPGHTAYLLVGPGGVFAVEHQVWSADEPVTTSPSTGLLEVGGRPAARRTGSVRAAAAAVHEALSGTLSRDIPVHPVLAIHGLALDRPRVTVGVTILPIADLVREVDGTRPVLSGREVDRVTVTARRLFSSGERP